MSNKDEIYRSIVFSMTPEERKAAIKRLTPKLRVKARTAIRRDFKGYCMVGLK